MRAIGIRRGLLERAEGQLGSLVSSVDERLVEQVGNS